MRQYQWSDECYGEQHNSKYSQFKGKYFNYPFQEHPDNHLVYVDGVGVVFNETFEQTLKLIASYNGSQKELKSSSFSMNGHNYYIHITKIGKEVGDFEIRQIRTDDTKLRRKIYLLMRRK